MSIASSVLAHRRASRMAARRRTAIVVLALLAGLIGPLVAYGQASSSPPAEPTLVTVEAGDTLWAIASRHASGGADIREVIFQIRQANGLRTSVLHPGQVIVIPAGR